MPGLSQAQFLTDAPFRFFFPESITISDAAFANDLAYQYLKPNPPGGHDGVNSGVVSIGADAPFGVLGFTCAPGDPLCDEIPRFSLFGGIVSSGSDTLFGGTVTLPSPIPAADLDVALCVGSSPTISVYCARDHGNSADIATNLTSDVNGLWTGDFFAATGDGSLTANFTGRYVLVGGNPIPEPSTLFAMLFALPMLRRLKRSRR